MIINNLIGFKWTKTEVTLFQLLCLATLTTEEFKDRTISQLCNNTDLFQLNTLDSIALGYIARVATSLVAICEKSMDKKAIQTIFCLVFMFNHVANKLSPNLKNIMRIKKKTSSNLLTLVHIKPQNYNQDNNKKDIKIPPCYHFLA